jgi:hypothetical protein
MPSEEEILSEIINSLEVQTRKKIISIHVAEDRPTEDELEALVIFTDGSKLDSLIKVQELDGKLAVRIQGNYI